MSPFPCTAAISSAGHSGASCASPDSRWTSSSASCEGPDVHAARAELLAVRARGVRSAQNGVGELGAGVRACANVPSDVAPRYSATQTARPPPCGRPRPLTMTTRSCLPSPDVSRVDESEPTPCRRRYSRRYGVDLERWMALVIQKQPAITKNASTVAGQNAEAIVPQNSAVPRMMTATTT